MVHARMGFVNVKTHILVPPAKSLLILASMSIVERMAPVSMRPVNVKMDLLDQNAKQIHVQI